MQPALLGIHVLDLTDDIAGQYCARMFADYGAQVTLVEPPDGCHMRQRPPLRGDGDGRESLLFFHLNQGKSSRIVDRGEQAGREALAEMAKVADVIIVGPGEDRTSLRRASPQSIICLVSDFGVTGPLAGWLATELVHQALSGNMNQNGEPDREPLYGCGDRASYAAGVAAFIAALSAVFVRCRDGLGQDVSVDIAETAASLWYPYATQYVYNGSLETRGDERQPLGYVRCADEWIAFWVFNDRWLGFCEVMGAPHLADDPRFSQPLERINNWNTLVAEVGEFARHRGADELVAALQARQLVAAKSYRLSALWQDCRHLAERKFWENVPTDQGYRTILGPQFRLSASPRKVMFAAPSLGQVHGPRVKTTPQTACDRVGMEQAGAMLATNDGPLRGVRVVDMTTAFAGPLAGRILAFLGAEVIHVESGARPNMWRHHDQVVNPRRYPDGELGTHRYNRCALFNSENINKFSLCLDIKRPGGVETLQRLISRSDVLVSNFRPGTLDRIGIGHAQMKQVKPAIIVVEMPAFGNVGEMANAAALAPTMELIAGMSGMIGYADGRPATSGPAYLDAIGGLHGAAAALVALVHRELTGEGQYVEVPQCEAAMQFIGEHILDAIENGRDPGLQGNARTGCVPHGAFRAQGDDEWVAIAVTSDVQWRALATAIGRSDMAAGVEFGSAAARLQREGVIVDAVHVWTQLRSKAAAAQALQAVGVPAAAVQNAKDIVGSDYLAARNYFTTLDHPQAGRHPYGGLPFHLSRTPGSQYRAAPCLGAHTRLILTEVLQLSEDEIAALERNGALDNDARWPRRQGP